jgi:hypothetical protein
LTALMRTWPCSTEDTMRIGLLGYLMVMRFIGSGVAL